MSDNIAIKVENVSKTFKLPHEKNSSIKSAVINFYKRNKSYEEQIALKDVSFEIKEGEFFGIVGRNGSGKSTLLKLLAGIYTPSNGKITVNGKLTPFIELGVGFNQELSGRENVFLNGALLGFSRKEMEAMYDDIVKFSEIERFMDQKLKNYSSGMQVRLAFSIAIRARTDILLLDEVLAVGDAAFQQKCFDYFEDLKRQKKTVVFVSHDMGAVKRFCTKAVYVKEGSIISIASAEDIADIYTVENLENPANLVETGPELSVDYEIKVTTKQKTDKSLSISVDYLAKQKDQEFYIGISIIRDGVSVAEITTSLEKPLRSKGQVIYSLDVSKFNGGIYYVTAAFFKLKNRELVAFTKQRSQFLIKGNDITKGAALKLEDNWQYDKN